jgi:hypothetical protein
MTRTPVVRQYQFLRFNVSVSGSEALHEAMHARLRYFPLANVQVPDLQFEFVSASPAELPVGWMKGAGRRLAPEVNNGFWTEYFAVGDRLFMNYQNRVAAFCDIAQARVRICIDHPEDANLWIATHPIFVTPLFEILKRRGYFNLHAAAVCVDGKALLLTGHSTSGKSTLAIALCRAGFSFMSDDYVFLTRTPDGITALGFPEEIDMAEGTAAIFPELRPVLNVPLRPGWSKRQFRLEDHWDVPIVTEGAPALLVFPQVAGTSSSSMQLMDARQSVAELVSNIQYTQPAAAQAHLDVLADLVRGCPCYRLQTGRDFEDLSQALRALVRASPPRLV